MAINDPMSNAADTASQNMNNTRDKLNSMAHTAADKASEVRDQAADWLSEQGEQMSATQKRLVENTTQYVQANPLKSIGIAVVAALVVGRLMR